MSRSSLSSVTSMRSTAPMMPPALPIALATWPSMPGRWAISIRMVSEYWADGVMLMAGAYVPVDRSPPAGHGAVAQGDRAASGVTGVGPQLHAQVADPVQAAQREAPQRDREHTVLARAQHEG